MGWRMIHARHRRHGQRRQPVTRRNQGISPSVGLSQKLLQSGLKLPVCRVVDLTVRNRREAPTIFIEDVAELATQAKSTIIGNA
jgi:hypothetical protein